MSRTLELHKIILKQAIGHRKYALIARAEGEFMELSGSNRADTDVGHYRHREVITQFLVINIVLPFDTLLPLNKKLREVLFCLGPCKLQW